MSRVRLTRRGELVRAWAVALLLVCAPGLSEALGTWLFGPTQ